LKCLGKLKESLSPISLSTYGDENIQATEWFAQHQA
jgi:hypothetical protein